SRYLHCLGCGGYPQRKRMLIGKLSPQRSADDPVRNDEPERFDPLFLRRRANPNRPASETWMVVMAAACGAIAGHTPSAWKMRRLALPSAVVRSSKLGCMLESGAVPSTSRIDRPLSARASARLAPTIPPPTMATSQSIAAPFHPLPAIVLSISSASLGAREVSTSTPLCVTTTSSSIRTPIPWKRLDTPRDPTGM